MEPNEAPGPATVHDPRPGAPRWGLVQRARYATGCTTDAVGMVYVVLRSIDGATQHWDLSISARRERDAGKRGDVGGRGGPSMCVVVGCSAAEELGESEEEGERRA